MKIGYCARYFNKYEDEVKFAVDSGFDFMQIWYDSHGIGLQKDSAPKENVIKTACFPAIIHAVLDLSEFDVHCSKILELMKFLGHRELIIHPVCKSEPIAKGTIYKLSKKIKYALKIFVPENITVFLENNSKLDPIFTNPEELDIVFSDNPELEFLLDIAHIDNYTHLEKMLNIKKPGFLHVADRHLEIVHEHLPLGEGNIDFKYIFQNLLNDFDGKIVLEITQSDEALIDSKRYLDELIVR